MHAITKPELWTYADAARFCGVTTKTIQNWIAERRISVIRLGRVCRIKPEQFKRELDSFEQKSLSARK